MTRPSVRRRLPALLVAPLLVLASGGASSARPASPRQPTDVEITVVRVERLPHSTQLLLDLHNPTDSSQALFELGDPAMSGVDETLADDLAGIHLFDPATNTEYLPYRDVETKECICSRVGSYEAGETRRLWWRSAPLPDGVTTVSVLLPDGSELARGVEVEE